MQQCPELCNLGSQGREQVSITESSYHKVSDEDKQKIDTSHDGCQCNHCGCIYLQPLSFSGEAIVVGNFK